MTDFEAKAQAWYEQIVPPTAPTPWAELNPNERMQWVRAYRAAFSAGAESMRERCARSSMKRRKSPDSIRTLPLIEEP